MENTGSSEPTHTALAKKWLNKKQFVWLEIGTARLEEETGILHAHLDRLPIGGFTGYVYFSPHGAEPPRSEPKRPAAPLDEGEDFI